MCKLLVIYCYLCINENVEVREIRMFNYVDLTDENIYKFIDLLNVSIYWKDIDGNFLGCNNYALNIFGFKSREEFVGKNDYSFMTKDEADKIVEVDRSVLQGEVYHGEESCLLGDSGVKTYLISNKVPLLDETGKIVGLLGVSSDITAIKNRMEIEKQQIKLDEEAK